MPVPRTLSTRLVATTVMLVAVVGLLVTIATTLAMRAYLTDQLDDTLRASSQRSFDAPPGRYGRFGDGDDPGEGDGREPRALGAPGTLTAYLPVDGTPTGLVAGPSDESVSDAALERLASVPTDERVHQADVPGLGEFRVIADEMPDGDVVVTALPTSDLDRSVLRLLGFQLLLTLLGVVAAAVAGTLLVRRTLRPLRRVARTAQEVTRLPLDTGSVGQTARVPDALTDERTEVGQVGASLNQMLGHVEAALDARHRSEQQVRQFVADASHELRTPLATIKGYAELVRRSPSYDAVHAIGKVEDEAARMSALVDDLLLLARLDAGRALAHEEVDLTRLVLEAVTDVQVVAPGHRWSLDLPDEPVTVVGDDHRLHQVVTNLLSNARRHTPEGTAVRTSLAVGGGDGEPHALLTVVDDGPGVPQELQTRVFERFTRGDGSRTRDSGGAGLGLSLVAAIVGAHGGTVGVESTPGQTAFVVSLPLAPLPSRRADAEHSSV